MWSGVSSWYPSQYLSHGMHFTPSGPISCHLSSTGGAAGGAGMRSGEDLSFSCWKLAEAPPWAFAEEGWAADETSETTSMPLLANRLRCLTPLRCEERLAQLISDSQCGQKKKIVLCCLHVVMTLLIRCWSQKVVSPKHCVLPQRTPTFWRTSKGGRALK